MIKNNTTQLKSVDVIFQYFFFAAQLTLPAILMDMNHSLTLKHGINIYTHTQSETVSVKVSLVDKYSYIYVQASTLDLHLSNLSISVGGFMLPVRMSYLCPSLLLSLVLLTNELE